MPYNNQNELTWHDVGVATLCDYWLLAQAAAPSQDSELISKWSSKDLSKALRRQVVGLTLLKDVFTSIEARWRMDPPSPCLSTAWLHQLHITSPSNQPRCANSQPILQHARFPPQTKSLTRKWLFARPVATSFPWRKTFQFMRGPSRLYGHAYDIHM